MTPLPNEDTKTLSEGHPAQTGNQTRGSNSSLSVSSPWASDHDARLASKLVAFKVWVRGFSSITQMGFPAEAGPLDLNERP